MQTFNTKEITELIRHRRSVFPVQYSGEEIDDAIIREILENANWAPSHKMTEPWRFVVFKGDGRKKLGDFMSDLYQEVTTKNGTFLEKNFNALKNKPLMASHVIAICMKRDEKERVPEVEEIEAVSCAVQNMALTAAAHGIGCYWGTGGVTYFEEAKEFFGLGAKDRLMGFMFFGMPKSKWPKSRRKPVEEKTTWVTEA